MNRFEPITLFPLYSKPWARCACRRRNWSARCAARTSAKSLERTSQPAKGWPPRQRQLADHKRPRLLGHHIVCIQGHLVACPIHLVASPIGLSPLTPLLIRWVYMAQWTQRAWAQCTHLCTMCSTWRVEGLRGAAEGAEAGAGVVHMALPAILNSWFLFAKHLLSYYPTLVFFSFTFPTSSELMHPLLPILTSPPYSLIAHFLSAPNYSMPLFVLH